MKLYENGITRTMTEDEQAAHAEQSALTPGELIDEYKRLLAETDYKTLKFVEGELTEEEYYASCAQRTYWRSLINELEAQE